MDREEKERLPDATEDDHRAAGPMRELSMSFQFEIDESRPSHLRDLDAAERDNLRKLEFIPEEDKLTRSECLSELGLISWLRFLEGLKANKPGAEHYRYFGKAICFYETALSVTPSGTLGGLSLIHNALGKLYAVVGRFEEAVNQFEEAIRCNERAGHLFNAGKVRLEAALILVGTEHAGKGRDFARAAQDNFTELNERSWIQSCQRAISRLENPPKGESPRVGGHH
jgi:tetratricopeptide (TPR) repeat protein